MGELQFYLTTGNTPLSWFIRMGGVGSHYSHAGIRVDRGCREPDLVSAHWSDGVRHRTLGSEGYDLAKSWTWVTIPCTDEQEDRHLEWVLSQVGKRYDRLALIGMADGALKGWEHLTGWSSQWFCSALAFQSIPESGMPLNPIKPAGLRTISPIEFAWIAYALGGKFNPAK